MDEASFVLRIEFIRNRSQGLLGLSHKAYINRVLERFNMENCSGGKAPIFKGDQFSKDQCPINDMERRQMYDVPYAFAIRSLLYAQTCTRPDISFVVGMLGRYQSNLLMTH